MSGTYGGAPDLEPTPAEQHLGDRLAALVDGELGHETRERVLAHLATCPSCKAEADAQRRLKSVFADTTPPPPSESLLARLQGLPAGLAEGPPEPGGPAGRPRHAWEFEYLPSGGALTPGKGFRIHEADRSPSRGRRFAFAAAGAVSLAAFALGGALTSTTTSGGTATAVGGPGGTAAGPLRTAAVGAERGGERSGERGARQEGAGASGGSAERSLPAPARPSARPVPPAAAQPGPRQSPRAEEGHTTGQHTLMTVPVLDATPTLHPPLIRPVQYQAQLPVARPQEPSAQPFAAVPSPSVSAAETGTGAVLPNIPPNR